jgi:hypothetical protein
MSYTLTQVLVKIVLTLVIAVPTIWGITKIWRLDVDVAKTISPKRIAESLAPKHSFVVTREENALYQNGEVRAVVEGCAIDEASGLVSFSEISKSGRLDLGKPFEFRKYVLIFTSADTMIGLNASFPEKGRMILKAKCSIKGIR